MQKSSFLALYHTWLLGKWERDIICRCSLQPATIGSSSIVTRTYGKRRWVAKKKGRGRGDQIALPGAEFTAKRLLM